MTMKTVSPQLIYQKAVHSFNEGDYNSAEKYLIYLVRQAPFVSKNSAAFNLLGLIYHEKNMFNQAIKFFRKSLEINPSNSEAIVNLSILLCDLGLYRDAEQVYATL